VNEERVVLGPGICKGCGQRVYYMAEGERHVGWRHADGTYRCPSIEAPAQPRRPSLSGLVDRIMRAIH